MIKFKQVSSEHTQAPGKKEYCTYAWIETDEIDSEEFAIAVIDYKCPRRTEYIFREPIWKFIADERTGEQQKFIDKNFDRLNALFVEFAGL